MALAGLWLAAFALLAQSFAIAAPPMFDGDDASSAAAELQALLGPSVVICTQADPAGKHRPLDCHDQCPLCRLVANAALLNMPADAPLPAPAFALSGRLGFAPQPPTYAPRPSGFSLARGPPSQT